MLRRSIFLLAISFLAGSEIRGEGGAFTPQQKKEIQEIVKKTVDSAIKDSFSKSFKHIQEAMSLSFGFAAEAFQKENSQEEALENHKSKIFQNNNHPIVGAPQGKKVAIVFTDPYCGHCHQSLDEFEKYLQKTSDAKLIVFNYPLFGKDSRVAAEALLAAHLQKKYDLFYKAFRKKILQKSKPLSKEELVSLAKTAGLNAPQFSQDLKSPSIHKLLREVILVGKDFKVTGTPTFIVQGVSGAKGRVFEGSIKPEECFLGSSPLQKK